VPPWVPGRKTPGDVAALAAGAEDLDLGVVLESVRQPVGPIWLLRCHSDLADAIGQLLQLVYLNGQVEIAEPDLQRIGGPPQPARKQEPELPIKPFGGVGGTKMQALKWTSWSSVGGRIGGLWKVAVVELYQ